MRKFAIIYLLLTASFSFAQDPKKAGDNYFDEANFKTAIEYYLKALKKDSSNVQLRHNIAVCYLNLNVDRSKAIPHLEWVVKQENFDNYAYYDLAKAYHHDHQFEKAIKFYNQYIKGDGGGMLGLGGADEAYIKLAKLGKRQCEHAKKLINKPIDVTFNKLGGDINTEHNEYQPYIPADESTLVYTTDEKYDSRYKIHVNNIFISEKEGDEWGRPRRLGVVNSTEDEFAAGLAANDKYLFVKFQRYEAFDDIFYAEKDGIRVSRPEDMGEPINTGAVESGATLSYSGDTLIFSSNREGGQGGMDLWMSLRLPDGTWGTPVNLGKPVNTPYDEDFPHMMPDGKTMFFSSNGHNSMGGFDVFKTTLNKNTGDWAQPRNFGYPVNNTYDNNTIAMSRNYRYAYVSDVREEGKGGLDIYRVVFNNVDANVFLHKCHLQNPNGQPITENGNDNAGITVVKKNTGEVVGKYKYDHEKGYFIMALQPGDYQLKIEIPGHKNQTKEIFVPDLLQNKIYELEIALETD